MPKRPVRIVWEVSAQQRRDLRKEAKRLGFRSISAYSKRATLDRLYGAGGSA